MFSLIARSRKNVWPNSIWCIRLLGVIAVFACFGCGGNTGGSSASSTANLAADPGLAAMEAWLAAEFDRLDIDPQRQAATAPSGEMNAVFDLSYVLNEGDPASATFSWTERMAGDYNQDGLVSVNDLTPIGQRFNDNVAYDDPTAHDGLAWFPSGNPDGDGAANWRAARVDGNGDGLIYLSDITTIAQRWNERLDGYRFYYQEPGDEGYTMLPNAGDDTLPYTIPRADADPGDANRPYRYSVTYYPSAMSTDAFNFYVAPYDASQDHEGTPSPVLTIGGGEPPVAALTADVTTGNPPLTVNFDASGSTTPEGTITNYYWDFYGSGFFTYHTEEPYATNEYTGAGVYTASVRVENDQHQTDTASVEITTNHAPEAVINVTPAEPRVVPFLVSFDALGSSDSDGTVVQYDWDWQDDGVFDSIDAGPEPAFSNYVALPGTYGARVRITDDMGATDEAAVEFTGLYGTWQTFTIDDRDTCGAYCSLAVVDEYPAISYYDDDDQCLRFIRATEEYGIADWGESRQLTINAGIEGYYSSLAIIGGRPAVAYLDSGNEEIRYTIANNEQGSSWPESENLWQVYNQSGYYITLIDADGRPAVAWQTMDSNIYYKRADDSLGLGWSSLPRMLDNFSDNCTMPSMSVVDGYPAVAFTRLADEKAMLYYVHAADAAGADAWNDPVCAATELVQDAGIMPSLAEINGNPGISYSMGNYGSFVFDPYFIRSNSQTGGAGSWNPVGPKELASGDWTNGMPTSLAEVRGYPNVAYYERDSQTLWHVWAEDYLGDSWMEPVLITDGGGTNAVGQYCDIEDVNGRPAVAYWDSTANNLKYAILR